VAWLGQRSDGAGDGLVTSTPRRRRPLTISRLYVPALCHQLGLPVAATFHAPFDMVRPGARAAPAG
jgi:hypothetical protein